MTNKYKAKRNWEKEAERRPAFAPGISVPTANDKPHDCTECTWAPFRGRYALKFANKHCGRHSKYV